MTAVPAGLTALLLVLAACGSIARAASGSVHQTAGYGLQMSVDTRWLDGSGYRPVLITVVPNAPTVADRTLRVEFLIRRFWSGTHDLRVQQDIEIPAGSGPAAPVQARMSVPEYWGWHMYRINVFEDGKLREKLCTPWTQIGSMNRGGECLPTILFVADALPNTGELAGLLPVEKYQENRYTPTPPSSAGLPLPQLPTALARSIKDLPPRWLDYSSLDAVCLSLSQLAQLRQQNPAAFGAVVQWTAAGGNLWVYGTGRDGEHLGRLEDLLGLAPGSKSQEGAQARGWEAPSGDLYGRPIRETLNLTSSQGYQGPRALSEKKPESPPMVRPPGGLRLQPPDPPPFFLRPMEMGLVVAIEADNPFQANDPRCNAAVWNWLFQAVGTDRWLWSQRHGLSMVRPNRDFWNFLIPGVGLAPVTEFCILITLFVAAIGPVNYFLLRRWKRLHLLVVTIPGSAAAVTLILFGYALISDGLGTRVRVRSVTHIDQRSGRTVCWARLSYYCGLAPWRGLTFPEDVAVFPLEQVPMQRSDRGQARELIWEEDQRFTSGWLGSRTPAQLVTVRSRATQRRLEIAAPGEKGGKWQVTNALGAHVECLFVQTPEGQCCSAAGLDPGATATLEPITAEEARQRLRGLCRAAEPAFPPQMLASMQQYNSGMFGFSSSRYYNIYWGGGSDLPPPSQDTGRMEQTFAGVLAGRGGTLPLLSPGSYLAVVSDSPEVVYGTPARQEASCHLILGKW